MDILFDEIVLKMGSVSIIDRFPDIYKEYSNRLKPHTNTSLREAIQLYVASQ